MNLGINIRYVQDLYTKNKTLLREIHKELNKWSYTMFID